MPWVMPGPGDDQGNAARALEEVHLVPEATFAEHVAVVGSEHHDRVLGHTTLLERRDKPRDPVIDVSDRGVVRVASVADVRLTDLGLVHGRHIAQSATVWIELVERQWPNERQIDGVVVVAVPIHLAHRVWIVRMSERGSQHPRALI